MDWKTITLDDLRQRHHATTKSCRLTVYDWRGGRVDWTVYDSTGNALLAQGKSASANEAKLAAEHAASSVA